MENTIKDRNYTYQIDDMDAPLPTITVYDSDGNVFKTFGCGDWPMGLIQAAYNRGVAAGKKMKAEEIRIALGIER